MKTRLFSAIYRVYISIYSWWQGPPCWGKNEKHFFAESVSLNKKIIILIKKIRKHNYHLHIRKHLVDLYNRYIVWNWGKPKFLNCTPWSFVIGEGDLLVLWGFGVDFSIFCRSCSDIYSLSTTGVVEYTGKHQKEKTHFSWNVTTVLSKWKRLTNTTDSQTCWDMIMFILNSFQSI